MHNGEIHGDKDIDKIREHCESLIKTVPTKDEYIAGLAKYEDYKLSWDTAPYFREYFMKYGPRRWEWDGETIRGIDRKAVGYGGFEYSKKIYTLGEYYEKRMEDKMKEQITRGEVWKLLGKL